MSVPSGIGAGGHTVLQALAAAPVAFPALRAGDVTGSELANPAMALGT